MDSRPIGMFDSGMGGISVLKTAWELLPDENFVYFGDDGNAPYGVRPVEEIKRLSFECARFLMEKGAKAIVIACNTATSAAINDIRRVLALPVISMEPAIKPALEESSGGRILMMATPATCNQERYHDLLDRLDARRQVTNVPCMGLVERVEQGDLRPESFSDVLEELLGPFKGERVDGIVLGCTHYPFVRGAIEDYARAHFEGACKLYDGHLGTVRQLARVLEREGLLSGGPGGRVDFYTSGDQERILPTFRRLREVYQTGLGAE